MKFTIVAGSHRSLSQSSKVAHFIKDQITSLHKEDDVFLLDLKDNPLPLWDEGMWEGAEKWEKAWGSISREIQASDAIVVVVPEWSGMAPGGVKNFFHLCGKNELSHKPGLLVGVSASLGGAYPIAELRMTSGKNTRLCYIPDHVIVRHAESILNGPEPLSDEDTYVRGRLNYSLKVLREYAKALAQVRASGVIDAKTYPFGM